MTKNDAIKFFGSQRALAEALGIEQPSVAGWGESIPPLRQLQIEFVTKGTLKADPTIKRPRGKPSAAGDEGGGGNKRAATA